MCDNTLREIFFLIKMELKDRIREAMEAARLKPLQLANAVGVSSGAVTHWLNGATKSLKADTANRMQQVTGYSANWIITGEGERKPATYTMQAEAMNYKLEVKLTPAAEALARMFDRVPTDDPLKWSTLYHSIVQSIASQIPAQTQSLPQGQERQPEESRTLPETRKTAT